MKVKECSLGVESNAKCDKLCKVPVFDENEFLYFEKFISVCIDENTGDQCSTQCGFIEIKV